MADSWPISRTLPKYCSSACQQRRRSNLHTLFEFHSFLATVAQPRLPSLTVSLIILNLLPTFSGSDPEPFLLRGPL